MIRLERPRLLARLPDPSTARRPGDAGFALICAPLGYGKSVLLEQWLQRHEWADRAIRLRCARNSREHFWRLVAHALAAAQGIDPPLPDLPLESARMLAADLEQPTTLVVDDYHRASDADNDLALAELALESPLLNLVVVARRVRILDGPLVTSRAAVRVIDASALAFTPEEARDLVFAFSRPAGSSMLTALEQADGWPIAVRAAIGQRSEGSAADRQGPFDPIAELQRFAMHNLEIISDTARRVLLATSLIDALALETIADFIEIDVRETRSAAHELIELGLLVTVAGRDVTQFRCHPAVKPALASRAERSFDEDRRTALTRARARQIESVAPFSAFKMLCSIGDYERIELLLAWYFTVIADESEETLRVLRGLPDSALLAHPAIAISRFFLEVGDSQSSANTLNHLLEFILTGLDTRRDPNDPTRVAADVPEPLQLPTLAHFMWIARLQSDLETAARLARRLDTRLTASATEVGEARLSQQAHKRGLASLPLFYREVARTSLVSGDVEQSHRNWMRLHDHAQQLSDLPPIELHSAATRTITDVESGNRWLVAALGGLALTALHNGHMRECTELIARLDTHVYATNPSMTSDTWQEAELARANLAAERIDPEQLQLAVSRLAEVGTLAEAWPLLLRAQTEAARVERGTEQALALLEDRATVLKDQHRPGTGTWIGILSCYEARLRIVLGDFHSADRLLAQLPGNNPIVQVERARRALYAGDSTAALLTSEQIGTVASTDRQRLENLLIGAVSAWLTHREEEAFELLYDAARLLETCELPSALWDVPHDALHAVALAAREAGTCDIVALVEAVPETVRNERFGRLTAMEQRTFEALAQHRSTAGVAEALFISPGTVKKHLRAVYRKLRVQNRDGAILQGTRMGLLGGETDGGAGSGSR